MHSSLAAAPALSGRTQSPRVLYCSCASPQTTSAGYLLVYRHLSALPGEKLMTVLPQDLPFSKGLNPAVSVSVPAPPRTVMRLRRGPLWSAMDAYAGNWVIRRFADEADRFAPEVVVSLLMPDWFMAAAALYAKRRGLPLVLFCHDDFFHIVPAARQQLASIYRQADVRLCVSKPMEQEFSARYGVSGEVLPPIPSGPVGPLHDQQDERALVIGYAGSVRDGYVPAILLLANVLGSVGGRLAMASPDDRRQHRAVWTHPAITDIGALPPESVRSSLIAAGVNVLAVVQSFAASDRLPYRFNFMSKLTEYSTYGMPVLIFAPEDASAVAWAKQWPDTAVVVSELGESSVMQALQQLQTASQRRRLAIGLQRAAREFDPAILNAQFCRALNGAAARADNAPLPCPA